MTNTEIKKIDKLLENDLKDLGAKFYLFHEIYKDIDKYLKSLKKQEIQKPLDYYINEQLNVEIESLEHIENLTFLEWCSTYAPRY